MEFDEKDLRREISYAIKNIHGVRQVPQGALPLFPLPLRCRSLVSLPPKPLGALFVILAGFLGGSQ